MSVIFDTLQTLERIMEYKKASYDICMAASRHAGDDSRTLLMSIAGEHDDHLREIPVIFKHLDFGKSASVDETPITEIRTGLFHDLGAGSSLDLVGAVIRIEREAVRLMRVPLEKADSTEMKKFLEQVIQTARNNIESLERIQPTGRR